MSLYQTHLHRATENVDLNRFFERRAVPFHLRKRISEYFAFVNTNNDDVGRIAAVIDSVASAALVDELKLHICGDVLRQAPFLNWLQGDESALRKLCTSTRSRYCEKGDLLFSLGERCLQIYFLLSGSVRITTLDAFTLTPQEALARSMTQRKRPSITEYLRQSPRTTPRMSAVADPLHRVARLSCAGSSDMLSYQTSRAAQLQASGTIFHEVTASQEYSAGLTASEAKRRAYSVAARVDECIPSPAHFGESCLWTRVAVHRYSGKCGAFSEFMMLSKASVDDLLTHSHFILPRFEAYRDGMLVHARAHELLLNPAQQGYSNTLAPERQRDEATSAETAGVEMPGTVRESSQ